MHKTCALNSRANWSPPGQAPSDPVQSSDAVEGAVVLRCVLVVAWLHRCIVNPPSTGALGAHLVRDEGVAGSNPATPTKGIKDLAYYGCSVISQSPILTKKYPSSLPS